MIALGLFILWAILVAAAEEAQAPVAHWTLLAASWAVAIFGGWRFGGWMKGRKW